LRTPGSSRAAITTRQRLVYKLHLRSRSAAEIARQLGTSERTIERDLQEIEASLKQPIASENLRTLKRAYAELEEIKRECWNQYFQPKQTVLEPDGTRVELDGRPWKFKAIDKILEIYRDQNQLTGLSSPRSWTPPAREVGNELRAKVAELTQEERLFLARIIEKLEQAEEN
jgi:hypothetical protein